MDQLFRELYEDETPRAHKFRYGVLIFDLITIGFVVVTSFFERAPWIEVMDALFGIVILADMIIRYRLSERKSRFFTAPANWADVAAVLSFLAPIAGEGLGFLRILRTLRLLHTYQTLKRLRQDFPFFRANEEAFLAGLNLAVFVFVMTGLIYVVQVGPNPQIANYADALYFTVTTLTTTGYGDITLVGPWGRMLAVLVMIFGVTLFLRLLQVLFRPRKIRHRCGSCGLLLHDPDAVRCKHCGAPICIETEGEV